MDDELSYCPHSLKVDGALVAQRRMPPREIVEALDVVKDVGACLVTRAVLAPVTALDLHRGEETLHDGVIPDIPGATHAARDPELREHPLKLLAAVLTPLIGVVSKDAAGPRRQTAISMASVTSCAVIVACMAQPTTRRE